MKKRLEWRVVANYTGGLPALLLVGPSQQFKEEVYAVCSFRARDLDSMHTAAKRAVALTQEYREKGWTVAHKNLTLPAIMAV